MGTDAGPTFYAPAVGGRWTSRRAITFHLELAVIVAACLAATWWQLTRALGGHGLSWFYTFEWPVLAVLAVAGWWHLIHEDPEALAARKQRPPEWDQHSETAG